MSDEETVMKKKRTTALKITVDEKIRKNIEQMRAFLAKVPYDCLLSFQGNRSCNI